MATEEKKVEEKEKQKRKDDFMLGQINFSVSGVASLTKDEFKKLYEEHWKGYAPPCEECWKTLMAEAKRQGYKIKE